MNRLLNVLLKPHWVYVLPLLHLAGCVLTSITDFEWMPVLFSEFPVGMVLGAIVWRFDHPLFWCGVFGTLWWYWLSRMLFNYLSKSV
jgi:hypothetical protein